MVALLLYKKREKERERERTRECMRGRKRERKKERKNEKGKQPTQRIMYERKKEHGYIARICSRINSDRDTIFSQTS